MAEVLAEGYNVFDTSKSPSGTIKYLSVPTDVISLIQSGELGEHILLVRGGTTTFLTMAYIVVVNPAVLAQAGMDFGAVMTATCLAAATTDATTSTRNKHAVAKR